MKNHLSQVHQFPRISPFTKYHILHNTTLSKNSVYNTQFQPLKPKLISYVEHVTKIVVVSYSPLNIFY